MSQTTIHFIANCMYGDHVAGGDLHFFEMARASVEAGFKVNFFGGHALKSHVEKLGIPHTVTLTDDQKMPKINAGAIRGQIQLFADYLARYRKSLSQLSCILPQDLAYAVTDYWFDVLPVVRSVAKGKMMVWHMQAPAFRQIVMKSRADVDTLRVASLHYWWSQNLSLKKFCALPRKQVFYVHPRMVPRLSRLGVRPHEMDYISFGVDPEPPGAEEKPGKIYDAVWIGRVHRQKGIEDLLVTIQLLKDQIKDFRCLIIGSAKSELEPVIQRRGLEKAVHFSGFVSEEEKFRLFRQSRVFLMPSRFEGSPRVIGEAIICELPVIAYDIENYRPVFGEFARYVPAYDVSAFQAEARKQILAVRAGENYMQKLNLEDFKKRSSWRTAQELFVRKARALAEGT